MKNSNKSGITRIIRRDGALVPYDRVRIEKAVLKATAAIGDPDPALAESVAARVGRILHQTYRRGTVPSVEDIQDIVENTLMHAGHPKLARSYIIYRHQRAQLRAARSQAFEMSDLIPYRKIYEVLLWNMEHGCDSVQALNETILSGGFPGLVRDCEERYREEIDNAARMILSRADKLRLVIVAGPSSSGKTTTTIRIGERLKRRKIRLRSINIDNYFYDLDYHPRDEFGDYDYETPQALDLAMINNHLERLLAGETVFTPHYDFKSGKRIPDVHEMTLGRDEILLVDSLHGLYKSMTASVPGECKFRLYIETLGQFRCEDGAFMRWADNRLLRRMIRDRQHRNSMPLQTIMHWHYVRTSELSHIIPYINTADCVVNTALPYEIPVLKKRLFAYFPVALRKFRNEPGMQDAFVRARRVYDFLKPIRNAPGESCIPLNSVIREFIGGSRYKY